VTGALCTSAGISASGAISIDPLFVSFAPSRKNQAKQENQVENEAEFSHKLVPLSTHNGWLLAF
jgi:hypothetical protein